MSHEIKKKNQLTSSPEGCITVPSAPVLLWIKSSLVNRHSLKELQQPTFNLTNWKSDQNLERWTTELFTFSLPNTAPQTAPMTSSLTPDYFLLRFAMSKNSRHNS